MIDDVCVNAVLCREGLALIAGPVIGRVSPRIGEMNDAAGEAFGARLGLHRPLLPDPAPITDLSVSASCDASRAHLQPLFGLAMRGTVEQVLGGNRFVVLAPERRLLLRLAVNGLLPLPPADPYGRQAIAFATARYLNRDIEFDVQEVDKSGGFLANIFLVERGTRVNIAQALLFHGLAEVHKRTIRGIPNVEELEAAQAEARAMRIGKWSDATFESAVVNFDTFYPVLVLEVRDAATFVVQFMQAGMREVHFFRMRNHQRSEIPSKDPLPGGGRRNGRPFDRLRRHGTPQTRPGY
jgi:endonuclease YncB( thermonuclease family)